MRKGTMDLEYRFRAGDLVCYNAGDLRRRSLGVVLNISKIPDQQRQFYPMGLKVTVLWIKGHMYSKTKKGDYWRHTGLPIKIPDSCGVLSRFPPRGSGNIMTYMTASRIMCIEKIKSS